LITQAVCACGNKAFYLIGKIPYILHNRKTFDFLSGKFDWDAELNVTQMQNPDEPGRDTPTKTTEGSGTVSTSRRAALTKLGLAVGAAYFAPTVLRIDRSARAQAPSGNNGNGNGGGGGNSGCTPGQQKKGLC
jgi:hypothetical protein